MKKVRSWRTFFIPHLKHYIRSKFDRHILNQQTFMRNYKKSFLVTAMLLVITISLGYSAGKQASGDDDAIFIRVYETGWTKEIRGIYIFYPDGKRDKTVFTDQLDPIGNAQKIYDTLNKISKMGYRIFLSNKFNGTGEYNNYYYSEYIYVKTKP
jgi:hypothetical protein